MDDRQRKEPNVLSAAPASATRPGRKDLEKIFREHRQRVFAAAYRVTGSADDAEDVLQTVFLRLARREGGSPLSDSPSSYLHRAAVNAALDVMRSRKHRRAASLDDDSAAEAAAETPGPDRRQEGAEIRRHVRAALTKLSDNAAEIFVLRYFEGYGNHEIAKMLGTSRSTVNVILHRARKRLQQELALLRPTEEMPDVP